MFCRPQQSSSQFMRHAKRRKLTVEDFNRALRWSNVEVACHFHIRSPSGDSMSDVRELLHVSVSVIYQAICGYGAQDALPFRSVKEGELFFVEDRDVNLVELALATNIPKGCAETMVRGTLRCYVPHAGSSSMLCHIHIHVMSLLMMFHVCLQSMCHTWMVKVTWNLRVQVRRTAGIT